MVIEAAPARKEAPIATPRNRPHPSRRQRHRHRSKSAKGAATAPVAGNGTAAGSRPFVPTRPPDDPGVDSDDEPAVITRPRPAVAETSKH